MAKKHSLEVRLNSIEAKLDALGAMLSDLTEGVDELQGQQREEQSKGIYKNVIGVEVSDVLSEAIARVDDANARRERAESERLSQINQRFESYDKGEIQAPGATYPPHLPDEDESYGIHPDLLER